MDKKTRRIGMCVMGVFVCGVAVGFFRLAAFGIDPFQAFMSGMNAWIPISFGTLYVFVNILLLLFSLCTDRHYIGLATMVNIFLSGYVVEYSYLLLENIFPGIGMIGRSIAFMIGIFLVCIGSAFYFTADLGVSTYDAVSLVLSKTWKVGEFKYIRIACDFMCVFIGAILCLIMGSSVIELLAVVGVGTVIIASSMGPLIDFFNRKVAQPFLEH